MIVLNSKLKELLLKRKEHYCNYGIGRVGTNHPIHLSLNAFGYLVDEAIKTANLDVQDSYGKTLTHYAVDTSDDKLLELLLLNGANPDVQNIDGCTPLHRCIIPGSSVRCAYLLLHYGCDSTIKNFRGQTALNMAKGDYPSVKCLDRLAMPEIADMIMNMTGLIGEYPNVRKYKK